MPIYFTSDLHLGDERVLRYRPVFSDIEDMDETIIRNWNNKVYPSDEVYIIGDLAFQSKHGIDYYLERMNGRKHLLIGNHEEDWIGKVEDLSNYFESVDHMVYLESEDKHLTLCHYPMLEWYGTRYGKPSYLLHGHIHARTHLESYKYIKEHLPNALNVGVDVNGYEPVVFEELLANNRKWYQRK